MLKKVMSVLLVLSLMVGMMPADAFAANSRQMVSFGSSGSAVSDLQHMLNEVDDSNLAVDGIFGNATKSAVISYQQSIGLGTDGIVGPKTWSSIEKEYNYARGASIKVNSVKSYQVKAIVDTTIRKDCYADSEVYRKISKGTVLTVVGEVRNKYNNLWYAVQGGGYIYNEKVEKVAAAVPKIKPSVPVCYKVQTTVDTTIRTGPYEVEDVKRKVSKGTVLTVVGELENKYGNLWLEVQGGGYIYEGKVTRNLSVSVAELILSHMTGTSDVHNKHDYKFSGYRNQHPHYATYVCKCGSEYTTNENKKKSGCDECYPHRHTYEFVGCEEKHPHNEIYKCTKCESGYCGSETVIRGCNECHTCRFSSTGEYRNEHPHYLVEQCYGCGKKRFDTTQIRYSFACDMCSNPILALQNGYIPDFHGRVIDIMTGTYVQVGGTGKIDIPDSWQMGLELCGLAPGPLGMICDGVNALFYIVEADALSAALSGASVFVSFAGVGSAGGKLYKRAGSLAVDSVDGSRMVRVVHESCAGMETIPKAKDYVKRGIWTLDWSERGYKAEALLGGWGNNFETIDNAVYATVGGKRYISSMQSIKSLDTSLSSYQSKGVTYNLIKGYIDVLAEFQGVQRYNGYEWVVKSGAVRELVIATPPVKMTKTQIDAFNDAIEYAAKKNVKVTTVIVS